MEVVGAKSRGRGKKTMGSVSDMIMDLLGLKKEVAQDRAQWKCLIKGTHPTRASMEIRKLNDDDDDDALAFVNHFAILDSYNTL